MTEQRLARLQINQSIKSGLLPAETLMPGPNSPLWSADRLTRPSFLDRRTAAAARTRPIMLPVLVDLGAFLPLRLELTCSSPAALRGVTARSASQHHSSVFVLHGRLMEMTPKGVDISCLFFVIHASDIEVQNVACVAGHCMSKARYT